MHQPPLPDGSRLNELGRAALGTGSALGPRRSRGAGLILLVILGLLPGCEADTKPPAKPAAKKSPASREEQAAKAKPKLAPPVPADAFPDLAAAIETLKTAAKVSDTESFVRAEQWIVMQGDAGVEPLGQILNDPKAEMEHRIAVCRTLRRLGPKAKVPFKQRWATRLSKSS